MSTSRDPQIGIDFTNDFGTIMEIVMTGGSRGADLGPYSMWPEEQELLFAPCCFLSPKMSQLVVGTMRLIAIDANVSTARPQLEKADLGCYLKESTLQPLLERQGRVKPGPRQAEGKQEEEDAPKFVDKIMQKLDGDTLALAAQVAGAGAGTAAAEGEEEGEEVNVSLLLRRTLDRETALHVYDVHQLGACWGGLSIVAKLMVAL
jgi:hypothetical protein